MNKLLKNTIREIENLDITSCCSLEEDGWIFEMCLNHLKPRNILEIGFFEGASAFTMLSLLENSRLTSVDPIKNITSVLVKDDDFSRQRLGVKRLQDHFGDRFKFICERSQDVRPFIKNEKFDFAFIDGDHWADGARNDISLLLEFDIKYALLDDFIQPRYSPKSIQTVFFEEFASEFTIKSFFYREAKCQGKNIPMVLIQNNNC